MHFSNLITLLPLFLSALPYVAGNDDVALDPVRRRYVVRFLSHCRSLYSFRPVSILNCTLIFSFRVMAHLQ